MPDFNARYTVRRGNGVPASLHPDLDHARSEADRVKQAHAGERVYVQRVGGAVVYVADGVSTSPLVRVGELVGLTEAAELAGLTRKALGTYRGRGAVPAPLLELACGPLWRRSTIEAWSRTRRRLGPRKTAQ